MRGRWSELTLPEAWRLLKWRLISFGPRRDVTVETANGRLTLDSGDWAIGKQLYVKRQYESLETQRATSVLKRAGFLPEAPDTLLDIGANVGMICIGLVRGGSFKRALAFEPSPGTFRLLTHNVKQNGLSEKIRCIPVALSSRSGACQLEISGDNSGDNRVKVCSSEGFYGEQSRRLIEVPAKTLHEVLSEEQGLGNGRVDLVWADAQGHEGHIFRGGEKIFSRRIPVVTEFWPYGILRSGTSPEEFCRIISSLFTHFYLLSEETPESRPISQFPPLFERYSHPRQICSVALVHAGGRGDGR